MQQLGRGKVEPVIYMSYLCVSYISHNKVCQLKLFDDKVMDYITSKRRVDEELWERGGIHLLDWAKLSFISDYEQNIEIVDDIIVEHRRP